MSNTIPDTNISLSDLHVKWTNANGHELIDTSSTTTPYKMSELRNALFTDGSKINSSGAIKISNIKGKHFAQKFNTEDTKAYSDNSSYSSKLIGTTSSSTYSGSGNTSNRRVKLSSGQSGSFPYSILLLTHHGGSSTDSPGLIVDRTDSNAVDEATVWFKVVTHNTYGQVQMGIVAKDMTLNNWTSQKSYLYNKHATYCDRLSFHGYGYHNYAGSRDDITSSSTIVSPQYKTGTYGSYLTTNFHNRTGATAGTMRSYNAATSPPGGYSMYFFKNSYANYSDYRASNKTPNHGLKIKWYETTIQASLESGSSIIQPVSPPSTWSSNNLANVFSGMYVSGTGIPTGDGAFIGEINTNYMKIYKGKGTTSLDTLDASSDQSNVTLTISGYLYWTLTTAHNDYSNAKIFGPPHTILPKYQAASSGSTTSVEIKEWAFYIGDTTSGTTNTLDYDLRDTEPTGTQFSYAVSYSSGTVPSTNSYEFAINVGGTYAISGSLSSVTPSSSGYAHTTHTSANINWSSYSMGARIQFLTSGTVVAMGAQNIHGGAMALYPDSSNTASATVTILGTGSTSTTRNYKYTTLSSPVSVSANSIYRLAFKNTVGGYAYHNISAYDGTATSSGNIKLLSGGHISVGVNGAIARPTSLSTTWSYGSTDLIFLPS